MSVALSAEEDRLWSIVRTNSLDFNAWTALIDETERVWQVLKMDFQMLRFWFVDFVKLNAAICLYFFYLVRDQYTRYGKLLWSSIYYNLFYIRLCLINLWSILNRGLLIKDIRWFYIPCFFPKECSLMVLGLYRILLGWSWITLWKEGGCFGNCYCFILVRNISACLLQKLDSYGSIYLANVALQASLYFAFLEGLRFQIHKLRNLKRFKWNHTSEPRNIVCESPNLVTKYYC